MGEGVFPVRGDLALDEAAVVFVAFGAALASVFVAFPGAFVFDVADAEPEQFDDGVVGGEMTAVLDDLPQLVVQRLDRVGTGYESRGRLALSVWLAGPSGLVLR